MANLGSDNTPIEGESFGLPSGYSFDEEGGDLVIRDTDGTVAMRRADGTWELESDLALNENDISGVGAFDSDSVNTDDLYTELGFAIGDAYYWTGHFDGASPDDRLATALSEIPANSTLHLEKAEYTSKTISKRLRIVGPFGYSDRSSGALIADGEVWTIDERCIMDGISMRSDVEVILNDFGSVVKNGRCLDSDITVNANGAKITDLLEGTVTFASGTEDGLVDSCSRTTVTDDGTNTVGDIA